MTKIKLCGMRRSEDIRAVNRLKPDYIGFVFWEKSSRFVTAGQAEKLREELEDGITPVGVFVDAPPETIAELLNRGVIDAAQLHGEPSEEFLERLRTLTDRPLIQAYKIRSEEDLEPARRSRADMVLLDSGAGSGQTFDWTMLRDLGRPYFLAGGLNPANVAEAVERFSPYAVDTSSGIETDGIKDPLKMKEFILAVKSADEKKG